MANSRESAFDGGAAIRVAVQVRATQRARLAALLSAAGFELVNGDPDVEADVIVVFGRGMQPGGPAVFLGGPAGDGREAPAAFLEADPDPAALIAAIHAVAAGLTVYGRGLEPPVAPLAVEAAGEEIEEELTAREMDVLRLLALGLPNKAIGLRLGISEHTAKYHVGTILAKLDAQSRADAVMRAARRGLLPL